MKCKAGKQSNLSKLTAVIYIKFIKKFQNFIVNKSNKTIYYLFKINTIL